MSSTPTRGWPRDAFGVFPTILFAAGAVVVALVALLVFFAYALKTGHLDPQHPRRLSVTFQLIGELVIYVPVGAYLLAFLPTLAKRPLRDLGLRAPNWREIGIGLAGVIAMTLAVTLTGAIVTALSHRHDTEAAISVLKQVKTPAEQYLFISVALVFAPMLEELGFRVFLFNSFARYASLPIAVALSGASFGLVHAASPWQLVTVSIPIAAGGIVLAIVYAQSRNYWSSVITHSGFNAIPLILYFGFHVKS